MKDISWLVLLLDCQKTVNNINMDVNFENMYSDIIIDCRELELYFLLARITHTKRDDNQVADKLAKDCVCA